MTLITTASSATANSYADEDDFIAYHTGVLPAERDVFEDIDESDYEGYLRTATGILDGAYQWLGRRTLYNVQALEWPRQWVHRDGLWVRGRLNDAYDIDDLLMVAYLDPFEIPKFLIDATCELARQLSVKNTRADDDSVNQKSVKVGSIAIDNFNIASLGSVSFIPAAVDMLCRRYGTYVIGINAPAAMMDITGAY